MTKREICTKNLPCAMHGHYYMFIHEIEYGIEDFVYLSHVMDKNLFGDKQVIFHKVKVRHDADGIAYINVQDKLYNGEKITLKIYMHDFWKLGYNSQETWMEYLQEIIALNNQGR